MQSAETEIGVVHTKVRRATDAQVAALQGFGVATVHEVIGRGGLMEPYMRPVFAGAQACGNAVTVLLQPGDNWMMHVVAEIIQDGDVVVAGITSDCPGGYFGDLLATSFKARGAKGLIIDAGVRDTAQYEAMGFPVWSKYVCAQGTVKDTLGSVNVPIICAGQLVRPGDIVIADDDGVVVVPNEMAERAAKGALARENAEADKRAKFAKGELGLDMYSMRDGLKAAGLRYVD
ncbi:MAG: 4-carboxy-4-hydroxy-2-oxoadipate aldolase/oxaloacetate decarboxylase [Propionibacteriaceae bacterium]|nr:4-carboxy-4-hydroxy-2-oxoadipate aldolase/oxaloacetate decarboxylase [Propionibacteriaceae bacterium]